MRESHDSMVALFDAAGRISLSPATPGRRRSKPEFGAPTPNDGHERDSGCYAMAFASDSMPDAVLVLSPCVRVRSLAERAA